MKKIQIIRGFNDILPQESAKWQYLENIVRKTLSKYNYDEVRLPILEKSELFHRSVGESSDIVSKETYDFNDRNGDSLTLRPEGTASCVRMVVENNLVSRGQTQKLWYLGPMFRYERPQKGRYRQFYQLGVEAYGYSGLSIDFDMISVSWSLFSCLGLSEYVTLELNNLGSAENRKQYSEALLDYLKPYHNALDADSIKRLDKNTLRILDSKVETTQNIIANAPKLINFIDNNLREEFDLTCKYLDHLGVKYNVNKNLVRGLDYYSGLVFEWTTDRLGAQSAVCAGGRYDSLVATLGGGDNFAIGFAVGMERLILLIDDLNLFPSLEKKVDIFFVLDNGDIAKSMSLVNNIRNSITDLNFDLDFKYGSLKSQFKKADKSNADLAIIIGENELQNDTVTVKFLKTRDEQQTINRNELSDFLKENIIKK